MGQLPHADPALAYPAGGNRITQAVLGAHDGGVFGLCALRDGTLVSGGGRDRRVVVWGSDYSKLQEVEVRRGRGSYDSEETSPDPTRAPNTRASSPSSSPHPHAGVCCTLICLPHPSLRTQVPEDFGPVRTVAEGRGDTLYVGTTRNSILQGSVHTGFSLLVQVSFSSAPVPATSPLSGPSIPPLLPLALLLTPLPQPFPSGLVNTTHLPLTCSGPITPPLNTPWSGRGLTGSTAEGPHDPAPARLPPALLIWAVSISVARYPGRLSHRLHMP